MKKFIQQTRYLIVRSTVLSLESGKKYGFIASIINIIMPVIAVALVIGVFAYELSIRMVSGTSPFLTGVSTGTSVVLSAISIIGLILFVLSMYKLSHYYNEQAIFKNVLYGLIITLVAGVFSLIIQFVFLAPLELNSVSTATAPAFIGRLMLGLIAVFVVAFLCGIFTAVLYWRAFTKLGEKSGVEAFKTAGLLYLIGTVLLIVAVGVIIVWIAWIYAAKGYKQLQPKPAPITSTYPPSTPPPTTPLPATDKIFCSYCGTENNIESVYCKNCGKPLHPSQTSV
jgi:uncharacterized membrane protein